MPTQELSIASGFYESDSLPFNAQRCVNLIPVASESDDSSLSNRALFTPPGIKDELTATSGFSRGCQVMAGVPFFVVGNKLHSFTNNHVISTHGTIPNSDRVSMANNGSKLVIVVDTGESYVWDGSTLTQITNTNYRLSSSVVFKDGFFVFSALDGTVFFNSALNDPLSFDALDFGTAEINPDKITALHVNHNELFVCGDNTIEMFQNIGGSGFPFQRIAGANIQKGVIAKHSLVEFDNTFYFLGNGESELPAIWAVTSSNSVKKISTSPIESVIQNYADEDIKKSFAYSYTIDGQFIYGITIQSQTNSRTFEYNATTSALVGRPVWYERQTGASDARWRAQCFVKAYGKFYVGDDRTSKIGVLDKAEFQDYGDEIIRYKTSSPFRVGKSRQIWGDLELMLETGNSITTGQGSDAKIWMQFSDDGGRTWSNEFHRSTGKIGEYKKRVVWRRLGMVPRQRVLKIAMSDPVNWSIYGAFLNNQLSYNQ